jgi:hypothetical protein
MQTKHTQHTGSEWLRYPATISIDQSPTYHVFNKVHRPLFWHQNIQPFTYSLKSFINKKAEFKAALEKNLNTHSIYFVE